MKICVLTHTFPRYKNDTAAPFMHGLCEGLQSVGNEVFVLAPYSRLYDRSYLKKLSYKLFPYVYAYPKSFHLIGYSHSLVNDKKLRLSSVVFAPIMIISGIIHLLILVRRERIDVVSAHWILPNGVIGAIVKKITGVKLVSTLPGSDMYLANANSIFRSLAIFAARSSDGITSNSLQLKDDLVKISGKIKKFIPIIYGVDTSIFKPDRSKRAFLRRLYGCGKDTKVIVAVGRLVEKKGFLHLVRAAREVTKQYKDVVFLLVGSGDQKETLENEIKRLGLTRYFRFSGAIQYNKLVHYYNLADIFILPSIRDEKGNLDDQSVSVIEAMSCGVPVITTNFPGYRLIIQSGEDGLLAPEAKPKKIANEIMKLLASPELRVKLGANARKKVVTEFTWKKVALEYTKFFQSL